MVEFFNSKFEKRAAEIEQAIQNNIKCKHIDKIVLLHENGVEPPKHDKIIPIEIEGRATFADYFNYVNGNFEEGSIYMVANNDIYFDDTAAELKDIDEDIFCCISRWNNYYGEFEIQGHSNLSQDVWVFRKPIPQEMIDVSHFSQGIMSCDNHIAYIAIVHDFKVVNPCQLVKCYHLHADSKEKTYSIYDREITNCLLFSGVAESNSVEYDVNNVQSYIGKRPSYGVLGSDFAPNLVTFNGDDYISQTKRLYNELLKFKLLKYNILKLQKKEHIMVKGVNA